MLLLLRMFSTSSCEYLSMILYHADHLKILQKLTSFSSLLFFSKKIDKGPLLRTFNILTKFGNSQGCIFKITTILNILLLNMNFNKSTIELHFLLISSMFAKFPENQRSIALSSIKYLNFKFL